MFNFAPELNLCGMNHIMSDEVFGGISSEWMAMFNMELLREALDQVKDLNITPSLNLVLEAFRYENPSNIKCVIIGQDPYPTAGDAQGLCFSTRGNIPESLKRIFGCLIRAGHMRDHIIDGQKLKLSGDLRPWAVQGVLLLNTALTTIVGKSRVHTSIWKPFIDDLMIKLATFDVPFMLWGGDAKKYAPMVRTALTWSHPSPLADNKLPDALKFINCDHFDKVNIRWDNLTKVYAFTDGACSANGKPGAKASYAAVIIGGQFRQKVVKGEVAASTYRLEHQYGKFSVVPDAEDVLPSNNRGELLGIIHAFIELLNNHALGSCEIISDSNITIKTLLEWLPNRLEQGTERELKNYDLVFIAWTLMNELKAKCAKVKLTHVNSHQPPPSETATKRERLLYRGNELADINATSCIR